MLDISCKMNFNNDMEELPTYEEWTKNMSLTKQIQFYYDVDIDNFVGDVWDVVAEVAENPNWLEEFKVNFKEYLQEREYIQ